KRRRLRQTVAGLAAVILLGGVSFAWWQERQDKQARLRQAEFDAEQARAEAARRADADRAEANQKAVEARAEAAQKEVRANAEADRRVHEEQTRSRAKGALEVAAELRTAGRFKEARREIEQARAL